MTSWKCAGTRQSYWGRGTTLIWNRTFGGQSIRQGTPVVGTRHRYAAVAVNENNGAVVVTGCGNDSKRETLIGDVVA